jgi:hypothetical protein
MRLGPRHPISRALKSAGVAKSHAGAVEFLRKGCDGGFVPRCDALKTARP